MQQIPYLKNPDIKFCYICFIVVIFFFLACDKKDSTYICKEVENTLKTDKDDCLKMNQWLISQVYEKPYIIRRDRHLKIIVEKEYTNDSIPQISDIKTVNFISDFLKINKLFCIVVYTNRIVYYLENRNSKHYHLKLINFNDTIPTNFGKYKFYETGQFPVEESGWLYHVKNNWYLESPSGEGSSIK